MNKSEIIFIIILIVAYIVSAIFLNIPMFMHLMFGVAIAVALIFALLLKVQHDFENEKIHKISEIFNIIMAVGFAFSLCYMATYQKEFIIPSGIFATLFLISLIITWVSGKNSAE